MYKSWHEIQLRVITEMKSTQHHLWRNALVYLCLATIEYYLSMIGHSQVLRADAFNNLSGILASGLLITGLLVATRTHDDDLFGAPISEREINNIGPRIQQSRFRYETIYAMISGLIMAIFSVNIIYKGIISLLHQNKIKTPLPITGWGALISAVLLFILYYYTNKNQQRLNNSTLEAAAKDILSDALTSLVTVISILSTIIFHQRWLDGLASIGVGFYILYSGIIIFQTNSLKLVDYFDPKLEATYEQQLEKFHSVNKVIYLKAYYVSNIIILDTTLEVAPQMTSEGIYQLSQHINSVMQEKFNITRTNIQVEPSIRRHPIN